MSSEIENQSLPAHVSLCAQRYQHLDERIRSVEQKVDDVKKSLDRMRLDFYKVIIGTGGTIVVAIIGAVASIKFN